MEKFKTDEEFKNWAIEQVENNIIVNNYPCHISHVSEVATGGCEWCDNTTRVIGISVQQNLNAPLFTKGHNNSGHYTIHEDPDFHAQSEWFVCGKCPDS
jgi:hypothetical protein